MSEELAYLGGFFDGEGCITVARMRHDKSIQYQVRVAISQRVPCPLLDDLRAEYGGSMARNKRKNGDVVFWVLYGDKVRPFLTDLLPYLRGKREQAEAALGYLIATNRCNGGSRLSDDDRAYRELMWRKLRELKGLPPLEKWE